MAYNLLFKGCPATGYFGSNNCSTACPDVNRQYCHIESGTCQGCIPGYQGHRCEIGNTAVEIKKLALCCIRIVSESVSPLLKPIINDLIVMGF